MAGMSVEARGQLGEVGSLLSPSRSQGLNSGRRAWQQAPLSHRAGPWLSLFNEGENIDALGVHKGQVVSWHFYLSL